LGWTGEATRASAMPIIHTTAEENLCSVGLNIADDL
jgi:hypothetical protein